MLLGLTEPSAGTARVVGLDPARRPLEVKRRVGYMPDSVGFYSDLSGRENPPYTAPPNRIEGDEAGGAVGEGLRQGGPTRPPGDPARTPSPRLPPRPWTPQSPR